MKIHVFTVSDETFRWTIPQDITKKYFKTKELRDDYFEYLCYEYSDNLIMTDDDEDECKFTDHEKWTFVVKKYEENLEIIEKKYWELPY